MTEATNDVRNTSQTAGTQPADDERTAGCCAPAVQVSCCEPEAKASCCGETVTNTCGCA